MPVSKRFISDRKMDDIIGRAGKRASFYPKDASAKKY